MKRALRILLYIAGSLTVLLLAAMLGLQIYFDSDRGAKLVQDLAGKYMDARLDFSRLTLSTMKRFPSIMLDADSISITYPHSRFDSCGSAAVSSRLLNAGRGEEADTLLSLNSLHLKVNPWHLPARRLRVLYADFEGIRLFAHEYDSTHANWKILPPSKESDGESFIRWISLGHLGISGRNTFVYTAAQNTVFAGAMLKSLELGGGMRYSAAHPRIRNAFLDVDSLFVHGRLPADTLAFGIERLGISQREWIAGRGGHNGKHGGPDAFSLGLKGRAMLLTAAFGRLWVPVELAGSFGWKSDNSRTKLRSEGIKANIAYIPLYLKGRFASGGDSPAEIDAQAEINGWSLDTLLRNYGTALTKMAPDFSTDATVNLKASAKGIISEDELPQVEASLQIPPAALAYLPLNIRSRIDLNASASLTPDKYATINLSGLNLKAEGLNLKASGNIDDLLGTDPRLKLNSNGTADLARLISYAPSKLGLKMDGLVNLKLNANTSRSQIESLSFPEAAVKATLEADKIRMKIPSDTIIAVLAAPKLAVVSTSGDGLASAVSADSIFFKKGMGLTARVRSMSNRAAARKIKLENGRTLTRLDFKTEDGMAMVRTGTTRAGIRDIRVTLTAMQKERVRPRISRDSLYILRQRAGANELPDFLQDKDLRAADIHISLDSTITAFIKDWSFAGNVSISRGFVATPEFPLRTRMRDFDAGFDDKTLQLRSFHLSSGTSDISAEGTLKGLRRALLGRMSVLNLDLNLNSGFINANELFAALNSRKEITADAYSDSEDDSRIVTDSLANAPIDSIPKCVVPANLLAKVRMHADSLHFGILRSSPLNGVLRARERTLQLKDANLKTNLGDAELSAFISTRTKKDMSAGLDVNMQGISVKNVLQLLPDFDSMIPALKTFDGKVNCSLSATSMLDKDMNLDLPSLKGVAKLNGQQMHISDAGSLRTVTSLLLFKNKNIGPIGDISANVAVHDNTLEVFPFEFDVDRYKLAMDGVMGITGGQDYYLSILKSPLGICFGVHLWQDDRGKTCYELCKARKLESGIPVYTKELDSLKINIAHVVRNIFLNTVKIASVHNAPVPSAQTGREISGQEYDNLQQFILDTKTQEEQDEFFDEFDTWLDKEIYNGAISAVNNVNNGQPDKKKQKQKDKK